MSARSERSEPRSRERKELLLNTDEGQMTEVRPAGAGPTGPLAGRNHRRAAVLVLVGTALVALVADIATKNLALAELEGRGPVRLLGGAVYLTLTWNSGAAFNLGADYTWVFPFISAGVIGWIGWLAFRLRSLPWAVALGLVLGGALGNLTDRIFRAPGVFVGHVVDMVSLFDPYGQIWPVFNLADSALVTGVTLAILLEITGRQRDGSRLRSRAQTKADTSAGADADRGDRL